MHWRPGTPPGVRFGRSPADCERGSWRPPEPDGIAMRQTLMSSLSRCWDACSANPRAGRVCSRQIECKHVQTRAQRCHLHAARCSASTLCTRARAAGSQPQLCARTLLTRALAAVFRPRTPFVRAQSRICNRCTAPLELPGPFAPCVTRARERRAVCPSRRRRRQQRTRLPRSSF